MSPPSWQENLSRRERQVMDILVAADEATAGEIQDRMPGETSYSAVRAVLRTLTEKKLITHAYDGPRYLYKPSIPRQRAKKSMLEHLLETFFNGSREELVATLLDSGEAKTSPEELDKLAELIERARREGK